MAVRYRVGRKGTAGLTPPDHLPAALRKLEDRAGRHTGPWQVKPKGRDRFSQPVTRMEAIYQRIEPRMKDAKVGDEWYLRSLNEDVVLRIVKVETNPKAELPPGSDDWHKEIRDVYQFVFAPKKYPGVQFGGVESCRRNTRDESQWSSHAWNLAIDIFPSSMAQGDVIEQDLKEFFPALEFIVWREPLHFDHLHVQAEDIPGGTPPCAR